MVDKAIQSRLLIPVVPLVVLGTYALIDLSGLCQRWRWSSPFILATAFAISGFNVATHFEYVTKPPTIFRQMADQLAHRIDPDHRVLFLPSQFRLCMMETLYLDARGVYRLRQPWIPDEELLKLYRIRFIMISNNLYGSVNEPPTEAEARRTKDEINLMRQWADHHGAKLIYRGDELSIYELEYPPVTGSSPVLTPIPYPFYSSLQADYIGPRFYRLTKTRR